MRFKNIIQESTKKGVRMLLTD